MYGNLTNSQKDLIMYNQKNYIQGMKSKEDIYGGMNI